MAERPAWRGHLRLALVSCPVALYAARKESNTLHFHFINPATGHRVRMVTLDAETDQEIPRRDLARGYEFRKDQYLLMSDEDFEAARIESSATLTIAKFIDAASLDPLLYDAAYYMAPDGDGGEDVFAVLRAAFAKTGRIALSRVVIGRRERAVAIMPHDRGMVAHTLYEQREIVDASRFLGSLKDGTPDPDMVGLAVQLIDRQRGAYQPADSEDRYEARLREVIEARLRGEGVEPESAEAEDDRGNVVDLMALLKKSLGGPQPAAKPRAAKPKPAAAQAEAADRKPAAAGPKGAEKAASRRRAS